MNDIDAQNATRLIRDAYGADVQIVKREPLDVEWAPVERWHLGSPQELVPDSVVIKTRRHGESGWGGDHFNLISERRALLELNGSGLAPELYASDDEDGVIIMEDMKDAVTVEKLLFSDDPRAATEALISMARTSGAINGSTTGIAKATWNPATASLIDSAENLNSVHQLLSSHRFPPLDCDPSVVERLASRLRASSMRSLTQWDVMPCNAMVAGDRTVIIDFESSNPRNMAMDGAAYAMGFAHYRYWAPLPDCIVVSMSEAWIDGVTRIWDGAPTRQEIRIDVAAASIHKTLERLTRLDRIVDPDQPVEELTRRRPQIVDSLERTAGYCLSTGVFGDVACSMKELAEAMRIRWDGTMDSRVFPAFNGGSREGWMIYHPI